MKAVADEILPCFLPLHPHMQASLLRSHAGGLSVVSAAECMLYAASEVSVILRQAVWPSTHPHSPPHCRNQPPSFALPLQYFSPLPCAPSPCLSGVLLPSPASLKS